MENASKALLIAGAILLCILIIAIGMFIYNRAQGTIVSSLNSLSTQEVEAFNNQFMTYQGVQKGTNVKNLMEKLIANASTYVNGELEKIPLVIMHLDKDYVLGIAWQGISSSFNLQSYIDACGGIKKKIKTNREYLVDMKYGKNGLIEYIRIVDNEYKDMDIK